jgi:hypothetical protein
MTFSRPLLNEFGLPSEPRGFSATPEISSANCHDFLEKLIATTRWFGSNLHVNLDRLFSVFRTVDELAGVFPGVGDPGFSISR